MKLSMMTLGCPAWDLDTICTRGHAYGFSGVDFRGYRDTLDITTLPLFTTHGARTRRQLADAGLAVSAISSSIKLCDAAAHDANLAEARRTIATARELGTHLVRVFGGGDPTKTARAELVEIGVAMMTEIAALEGAGELCWLVETHDTWTRTENYLQLYDRLPAPTAGVLWDVCLTTCYGGDTVDEAGARLAPLCLYTHLKDAVPAAVPNEGDWRYVLPGTGTVPLTRAVQLLRARGYDGWLVCEHEKRWHPDLMEPEQYFPAFVAWARGALAAK